MDGEIKVRILSEEKEVESVVGLSIRGDSCKLLIYLPRPSSWRTGGCNSGIWEVI